MLRMKNLIPPPVDCRTARCPPVWLVLLPAAILLLLGGCSTPIGADRLPPRRAAAELDQSALTTGKLSSYTTLVLHRFDLDDAYQSDPAAALLTLHRHTTNDSRRDVLFALAELNYHHAYRLRRSVKVETAAQAPDYFLTAAIYAYFYLLNGDPRLDPPPTAFDRRFRLACDLYNLAVAQGLGSSSDPEKSVRFTAGPRHLAPGVIDLTLLRTNFKWDFAELDRFLPADSYRVRGLTVRDRHSGLGAPLIVVGKELEPKRLPRRFPATVVLHVNGDVRDWSEGRLTGALELYSTYETDRVALAGQEVPLESDFTAPLAWGLNDAHIWKLGPQQFFTDVEQIKSDIYFTQPYEAGRVPVVFVHGTFSSPVWWAEMWNTLRADPVLREHCQFWNFIYNSGNPISHSASRLRESLQQKIQELDPEGKDPALRRMVIIGHSQGGLLAKLTATDTGDALWRQVSDRDLDSLNLTPEVRDALRANFFFTRLPCVERVVFLSTPHRGSYLATGLVRGLARLFMRLPRTGIDQFASLERADPRVRLPKEVRSAVPSSLDGMSPKNPWLLALAEIPPATGVKAHSIIAIKGDEKPPRGGDGVVKYTSAHVSYTESERIVRSGHSCQDKPPAIEEVRRILLEHLATQPAKP